MGYDLGLELHTRFVCIWLPFVCIEPECKGKTNFLKTKFTDLQLFTSGAKCMYILHIYIHAHLAPHG
jgi:hypothetical protein